MPVPRKRKSNSRRKQQRSHDHLHNPGLGKCPSCEAPKLPHRMCPACGWYADRTVIEVQSE